MKSIIKLLCFFWLIINSVISYAQTTTINYLTSSLSTTACNVFSSQVTINNILHTSYAGGVSFSTTYGLFLATTPLASPPGATAFVINYNFVPGNNYTIAITALGNSTMYLKTSVIPNLTSFLTNGSNLCKPDNYAYLYSTAGYGQSTTSMTGASATFNVPQFSIPAGVNCPYLMVWSSGGNLNLDGLSISKIVITSTPIVSFSISPASVPITCGSITPVTFTVNNGGGTTGITNYTWNLGATPNGWKLPNGTAAPATYSTGTTNTLTLTPICGSVQKNVSATVTANGNTYNTNTSTVSITQPALSINGNSTICSGSSNYLINGLPCNASVAWSITPATGIANLSCSSCTTTSLSYVSNGTVTLTAIVSNLCGGANVTMSRDISIGSPNSLTGTYSTVTSTKTLQTVNFVPSGNIYAQYQWPGISNIVAVLTSGSPSGTGFYSFTNGFSFNISSGQSVSVYLTGNGSCGQVNATRSFIQSSSYSLVASPNPATNNINVAITEVQDTASSTANSKVSITSNTRGITKMFLYDFNTGVLVKQWTFKEMESINYNLNIVGVKTGVYVLKMERNNKITSTKIIVK